MFRSPLSQALNCFKLLFRSFQLCGYFQPADESVCTEEYLSFLDELRKEMPDLDRPRIIIIDAVSFILRHEALKSRPHLARIFKLSCLCLDEDYAIMPSVKFGPVRTDDPKSKLIDTILPVQSFFINVGRSIDTLTTASSISEFLAFEPTFGSSAFSDTYSPWDGLNCFDRSHILSVLKPKSVIQKADARRIQFKNPKSRSVTKSLPPSSSKIHQLSGNLIVNCQLVHLLKTLNCTICTFVFICIYVTFIYVPLMILFIIVWCLYGHVILILVFLYSPKSQSGPLKDS